MSPCTHSRDLLGASWCFVLLVVFAAGRADAADLLLGVTSEYSYTSNFFSSATNADPANSFLFGPTLDFSNENGRLTYDLNYVGAYQTYVDQSGVDAPESRLRGRATYEIDSRTTLRLTDRFRDVSNLRFSRQDIELADTALDPNQNRYFRNDLEIEVIHELTRLLEFSVHGAHHWTDFRQNLNRNDSQAFEVGSEVRYRLADRHAVGVGATFINQDFQEALSRLGSVSNSITTYLLWNWDIADNVVFTASGGPSFIRSEYDDTDRVTQNQFVGGRSGGDLFRAICRGNRLICEDERVLSIAATGERVGRAREIVGALLRREERDRDPAIVDVASAVEVLPDDAASYAAGLYAALHRLDDAGCASIVAAAVPDERAWDAVRDRLERASARA